MRRIPLAAAFSLVTLVAPAVLVPPRALAAKGELDAVPLLWKPSAATAASDGHVVDPAKFATVRVRVDAFADGRAGEKTVLGEQTGESGATPITTPDDAAKFVTDRFLAAFEEAGIPIVVDDRLLKKLNAELVADPKGTVTRAKGRLTELKLTVGKNLEVEVRLEVALEIVGGDPLWLGTSGGSAGRIARSYTTADAQEALSDALAEAIAQLLRTPDFVKALSGQR